MDRTRNNIRTARFRNHSGRQRGAAAGRKDTEKRFTFKMQKKLAVLYILVLLAFVGLSARLVYIYRSDSDEYKKQVLSHQEYDSTVLPYKRGDIVDAKGSKLAYSEKVYNLVIDPKRIGESDLVLNTTLGVLKSCFAIDEAAIRQYVKENPDRRYYVTLKQLTYDEVSAYDEAVKAFEEQREEAKKAGREIDEEAVVQGVWFEEEYKRVYPFGSLACDVIGFTGKDNEGTYGLEEYYNDTLNGTNGREYGYLNDDSTLERTIKPAQDGNTIVTSIDANIQKIVEKHILAFNEEHKGEYREGELGSKNTGVIVMNPKTAEILAMGSYPVFDLNNPTDLSAYYTEQEIAKMEEEDTLYDTLNQIWRNFCIQDTYEPGSTAKSITISAALDSGTITGNESYECQGRLNVSGHNIKCHNVYGHGVLSVSGALEQSCNVALMKIAASMGTETFMKYLTNYNIGLRTNIDLAGEARTAGLVFDPDKMVASDLAISSFGQGYNVTMIQIASAFSAIINGGYYNEPHVVTEVRNSDGITVKRNGTRVLKQVISEEVSEKMRGYLAAVCTKGTGKTAVPSGYLIGGKTGTAETVPRKQGNYVVSFIGFAPVDDPQVVVYVVVDRPNVPDQPHSSFAMEVAREIFTEILPYMNIFRTEELSEEQIEELKALNIIPSDDSAGEEGMEQTTEDGAGEDAGETGETPEDGSSLPDQGGTPESGDEQGGTAGGTGEDGEETTVGEREAAGGAAFTTDEETGNLIDMENGQQVDPVTMEYIDPTVSLFE